MPGVGGAKQGPLDVGRHHVGSGQIHRRCLPIQAHPRTNLGIGQASQGFRGAERIGGTHHHAGRPITRVQTAGNGTSTGVDHRNPRHERAC